MDASDKVGYQIKDLRIALKDFEGIVKEKWGHKRNGDRYNIFVDYVA